MVTFLELLEVLLVLLAKASGYVGDRGWDVAEWCNRQIGRCREARARLEQEAGR